MEIEKSEAEEKQLLDTMSQPKEIPLDTDKISIEGTINWKMLINLKTLQTEIVYNDSVSNEGAILALSHQILIGIINHNKDKMNSEGKRRFRITQFELQKLFTRCLNYIIVNKDNELAPKEENVDTKKI